ncbi:auxin efflux carrier [Sphaerosporella brunnea]|uniref:Auxin efflux carrier n=1 Tax=Sphaerosporella brunnea TaxID=1250544 RepID=A0A5J5F4Q2_9PEZI|nr:auxin efflux carrier [Sphaerosporella brunnea]
MSGGRPGIGDVIFIAFKPIVKMAAIAIGGMVLCKKGILSPEATKANAGLILNLLLPMLIFSSVTESFDASNMQSLGALVITAVTYMTMGLCFGFLVRWLMPLPKTWRSGVLMTGSCSNWGDLPIAFVLTIAKSAPFNGNGDIARGVAYASIFMVVQALAMFSLGGVQLVKRDFQVRDEASDAEKGTRKLKSKAMALFRSRPPPPESLSVNPISQNDSVRQPALEPTPKHQDGETGDIIEEDLGSRLQTATNSVTMTPSLKEGISERRCLMKRAWKSYLAPVFSPPSLALIVGLIVANIPKLKSLFIQDPQFNMPAAPDDKPPLDFVMDICGFGGGAVPVIGLILLGTALSRMQVKGLPEGFWKSAASMAFLKLVVGPIIGIVWTKKVMLQTGLMDPNDKMLQFMMIMCAGVPSATLQVYLTNMHAAQGSVEMSALSAMLLAQYSTMLLTLTILVSYTLSKII